MDINLRKFTKFVDKTFIEGGKEAKEPVLLVSVAAVFKNPWHGQGFVEDLRPTILDLAPKLGDLLVPELIKEIGSPEKILAYGKAGVVGLNGEIAEGQAARQAGLEAGKAGNGRSLRARALAWFGP